ncbi:kinase-like domain-containing protein [Mycena rebaudengoi]|nr:kinase-like domain-containing protein [Mycena rebaudengoi]
MFSFSAEPTELNFEVSDDTTCGSFQLGPSCIATDRCGTLYYMSPSQYSGDAYSFETDVWGLGMIMFRMLTGRLPFGDRADTSAELRACYRDDPILFKDEEGLDEPTKDLISRMLTTDPAARATIPEIMEHQYFDAVPPCRPLPWAPRTPYIPKVTRPALIAEGTPYLDLKDPLPGFSYVSQELFKPTPVKRETWVDRVRNAFNGKKNKSRVVPTTVDASVTVCGSSDGKQKTTTPVRVPAPGKKTRTATSGFSFAGFFKRTFTSLKSKSKPGYVEGSAVKSRSGVKPPSRSEVDRMQSFRFPPQPKTFPAQSGFVVVSGKKGHDGIQEQPMASTRSILSRVMGWLRRHYCVNVKMGQAHRIDLTEC